MEPDVAPRRSKREHQPSAKAAAASTVVPPSAARRSHRRRVTRSASPAPPTRNSSPVRGPPPSASSDVHSVVVDAMGPNGQRRRLRAAAHTTTSSGVTHGVHSGLHTDGKVLGRYSSHDCALLCEVILGELKKQTLSSTVLLEARSPAFIRWGPVAKKMATAHKLRMTPRACQLLWKFLAYGHVPVDGDEGDELLPDSDEEDFHLTSREINTRSAVTAAEQRERNDVGAAQASEEESSAAAETTGKQAEQVAKEAATQDRKEPQQADAKASSVRLYPSYSLPTGAPDAWYRPFGPKDALPLTFVASRFLRRKANPRPTQSLLSKTPTASSSAATADLKRKLPVPANLAAASKKPKAATPPVSTAPRTFTPSSTPPPAAKRARSELEFFELRLREEQAKTAPGGTSELSAPEIQRKFGEASADVRRECQTLAAHDIERFNREVVRLRIWQKAMGVNTARPRPALPATAASSQAISTKLARAASAQPTASSAAKAPATTPSSERAAALLAHAAAVAAKAKSADSAGAAASAPKATEPKRGGGSDDAKAE